MHHSIRHRLALVPFALVLLTPAARGGEADALPPAVRNANAQLLSQFFAQSAGASAAVLEYRRKLAEYQAARAAFDAEAGAYWSQISEKRKGRNAKRRSGQQVTLDDYVLEHPPLYNGPKKPVNPEPEETPDRPAKKPIPVVADFLRAAQEPLSVHAAARDERGRVQTRLCTLRARLRTDPRAGRARLFVRDRRHRQLRRSSRHRAWRQARDLDRDGLQPVADHQQRRAAGRAGPRTHSRAFRESGADTGTRAPVARAQACCSEEDGRACEVGARHLVGAREDRQHRAGLGHACDGARHRYRADAADPQAADVGAVRPRQGLQPPAHRGRDSR